MIYTISSEVVEALLDKELSNFEKEPEPILMVQLGGRITGLYELYSKLDGVPIEQYKKYAHRIAGICELKSMLQFP